MGTSVESCSTPPLTTLPPNVGGGQVVQTPPAQGAFAAPTNGGGPTVAGGPITTAIGDAMSGPGVALGGPIYAQATAGAQAVAIQPVAVQPSAFAPVTQPTYAAPIAAGGPQLATVAAQPTATAGGPTLAPVAAAPQSVVATISGTPMPAAAPAVS
ncbi:MAG: hypothetical protein H7123_00295, partial [Thermoleophilia bacterium]|nr:hypothetical protein [Thermoleophilia bacterium]